MGIKGNEKAESGWRERSISRIQLCMEKQKIIERGERRSASCPHRRGWQLAGKQRTSEGVGRRQGGHEPIIQGGSFNRLLASGIFPPRPCLGPHASAQRPSIPLVMGQECQFLSLGDLRG